MGGQGWSYEQQFSGMYWKGVYSDFLPFESPNGDIGSEVYNGSGASAEELFKFQEDARIWKSA
ncbi:hypothetical protein Ancab_003700 [Ancistrocladus abbreviatus]